MVKIKAVKNTKIESAYKNVGRSVEPLSDAEFDKLIKKYRSMKNDELISFGDKFKSKIIVGKLPEIDKIQERVMK